MAMLHLMFAIGISSLGLLCILSDFVLLQMLGVMLVALSQLLWFIILHECGHRSFFPKTWANDGLGHLAGILAILPYAMWKDVHAAHHVWTGWKDVDPTTRVAAQSAPQGWKASVVNIVWTLRLPLFALIYRLSNFWNPRQTRQGPLLGWVSLLLTIVPWIPFCILFRDELVWIILAHGLFLILFEAIMLSQHTHIEQSRSLGKKVNPFRALDQVPLTRSLIFPSFFARWFLLHFNEHERHHEFPSVPGYYLDSVKGSGERRVHWVEWWLRSHRVAGTIFLFQDEKRTGIRI
jgi:fatty acid desaturase